MASPAKEKGRAAVRDIWHDLAQSGIFVSPTIPKDKTAQIERALVAIQLHTYIFARS